MPSERWRLHLIMLTVAMVWGGAFPAIKVALRHLNPAHVALGRFLVAAVPFGIVLALRGAPRFTPRELILLPLLGFLSVAFYHVALNWGEQFTPAGTASLIIVSAPLWTALLSWLMGHEEMPPSKIGGVLTAFTGVVLIVLRGRPQVELALGYTTGALAILGSAMAWALYTVVSKPLLERHGSLPFTAAVSIVGTALLAPALPGFATTATAGGLVLLAALVFLGLLSTFYGVSAYIYSLKRLSPTETMVYVFMAPVFALLTSYIVLGETVTIWAILGGVLVVVGVAWTNRTRHDDAEEPVGGTSVGPD